MIMAARKWGIRTLTALALIVLSYATAGMIGGTIPANAGWHEPADGVRIFVESNGVHTGIIVPKVAAGIDWRGIARPEDLGDPRYAAYDHLAFGWGDRTFYLETPTWAHVRAKTILAAALGSDATLVHIDHLPAPAPADDVRAIMLRPEEYHRLAAFISASVADRPTHHRGYGPYDAFYTGRGHYDALRTCNAWTGAALRYAGVRVGAWTPFPVTVMGWFRARNAQ